MRRSTLAFAVLLTVAFAAAYGLAESLRVETHTCANGMTVLVAESHALPLVTIEIAFRNGSMTESPEYNGLSHLYEHMFFKANAVIPSQEAYLARLKELGAAWNGTTNTERVNYFFTMTSAHLKDGMVFMRDAITTPLFDAKELERERVVVTGEIDRNESNPNYYLYHETLKRVWWRYPSYKDPLGRRETVLSATPEMMRTIQKRYYVPNNSVLLVTGDVKAAEVFALADSLYAGWAKGDDPFVRYPLVVHPPIPKTEVVLVEQPVKNVILTMTWHGPSTVGPNVDLTYAADLLGYAVAQPSSSFQRALVDSGACVAANFSWLTQRNVGPISLTLVTTPEKADACTAAALAELPRMREPDYLSEEERKNAALALEVDFARQRERPSEYAHTLSFWWASSGLDYYRGYVDGVKKATQKEIARFMDTYVLGKPYVFGAMVSPAMAKEKGLDRPHFEALLAAPRRPVVPAPALAAAPVVEGDVFSYDLNGMQVLVKRIPGAELVAMHLYVRGGVQNWTKEKAGVERLAMATAASGGTEKLPKELFARRLETMGSTLDGSSDNDDSTLSAKSFRPRWQETFDLLADAFLHPALPSTEIERERQRMLAGLKSELENPDGQLALAAWKGFYAGHPYENRADGTLESVAALTRDDASRHLGKLRETSRLLLVVAGDLDPGDVLAKARGAFGGLPRGGFRETPLPSVSFDGPKLRTEARPLPTNYIQSGFPAPTARDPEHAAARVTMSLLGYREFQEVRTRRNLSYAPRAWFSSGRLSRGVLYVTATDPAATMKVMFDEARKLRSEPVPEKELTGIKETLLTGLLTENESTDGQAALLARAQLLAGDFREEKRLIQKIRAVTAGDVQAFAKKYFRNMQTFGVGDAAAIEKVAAEAP